MMRVCLSFVLFCIVWAGNDVEATESSETSSRRRLQPVLLPVTLATLTIVSTATEEVDFELSASNQIFTGSTATTGASISFEVPAGEAYFMTGTQAGDHDCGFDGSTSVFALMPSTPTTLTWQCGSPALTGEVTGHVDVDGQYIRSTLNGFHKFRLKEEDVERVDEDGLIVMGKTAVLVPSGAIVHESGHVFYPSIWPEWKVSDFDNQWAIGQKATMSCTGGASVWIRDTANFAEHTCKRAANDFGMHTDFSTLGEGRNPACWYEAGSKTVRLDGGYWKNPQGRLICRVTKEYVYPTKAPTEMLPWCSCYAYTKTWENGVAIPPAKGTVMCQNRHRGKPHKSCRPADDSRYAETGCPNMMCRFRVPPRRNWG